MYKLSYTKSMRVVSLVPSWTETLLAAGVEVVGRTRFCIHPRARVSEIPIIGGTKDWNWERIADLKPDLLLLDQEENPRWMADDRGVEVLATHVTGVEVMPQTLGELGRRLGSAELQTLSERWREVLAREPRAVWVPDQPLPGLLEWGREPDGNVDRVLYMIWQNPWMAVARDTFIGSVLKRLGIALLPFDNKYPRVDLAAYDPATTLLLFSSEPFPFLKRRPQVAFPHAFVDGECFSWFGLRSLEFLEANS